MRANRELLMELDGPWCWYCGVETVLEPENRAQKRRMATLDHVIPRYHRGPKELWNARLACFPCNQAKRHRIPHPSHLRLERIDPHEAARAKRVILRTFSWLYPMSDWPPDVLSFAFT